MNYLDKKIEDAYNLGLKLGIENATEFEKKMFRKELKQLVVASIDEVAKKVATLTHDEAQKFIGE